MQIVTKVYQMIAVKTPEKSLLFKWLHNEWIKSLKQEFKSFDPEKYRQENLLRQIEAAKSHGKLAIGIAEVYEAAQHKKGKLLIGEKAYLFPPVNGILPQQILPFRKSETTIRLNQIIIAAIEKVLEEGGAIEFIENGKLKKYRRMVMIEED